METIFDIDPQVEIMNGLRMDGVERLYQEQIWLLIMDIQINDLKKKTNKKKNRCLFLLLRKCKAATQGAMESPTVI